MEEIWKNIKGFEGLYLVSNLGRVKSIKKGKHGDGIIRPYFYQHRICIALKKDKHNYRKDLARLVADNFLSDDFKGQWIEHIDGNRFNNAVSNLKCSGITEKEYFSKAWKKAHPQKKNNYRIDGKYAYVELSNTHNEMICDIEDWERLKCNLWLECLGYAVANDGKLRFHREVMNPPSDMIIDHINRNRRDNRKANLRITTYLGNSLNQEKERENTTSGYIGVRQVRNKKYTARGKLGDKTIHLGTFETREEAIKARQEAEIKYFQPVIEKEALH